MLLYPRTVDLPRQTCVISQSEILLEMTQQGFQALDSSGLAERVAADVPCPTLGASNVVTQETAGTPVANSGIRFV